MRLDIQDQEQASIRSAIYSRPALACQSDLCTAIHAGRDLHLLRHAFAFQSAAAAGAAWDEITSPRPAAGRADRGLHHLAQNRLTHLAHFTLTVACGTARRRCARLRTGAITTRTGFIAFELESFSIRDSSSNFSAMKPVRVVMAGAERAHLRRAVPHATVRVKCARCVKRFWAR